jgi:hypothetical protein
VGLAGREVAVFIDFHEMEGFTQGTIPCDGNEARRGNFAECRCRMIDDYGLATAVNLGPPAGCAATMRKWNGNKKLLAIKGARDNHSTAAASILVAARVLRDRRAIAPGRRA